MKRLLYLISMVASSGFSQIPESACSPCLTELTQNQSIASSKLGGEDPGMELAFPYVGNFEVFQGAYSGLVQGIRPSQRESGGSTNSTLEYNTHG